MSAILLMATPVPLAQSQQRQNNGQEPDVLRSHALLTGVAIAAQRLLSIADFDAAVEGALEAIAMSAGIDRIFIYEHHSATPATPELATCPYE